MTKKLILFVAEAVTLAHVARPLALASALDAAAYDIALACDARCDWLTRHYALPTHHIHSIGSAQFLDALARGSPVYRRETLSEYVKEDLTLIERVRPDLIVGDFRLSLSISARLARVPYLAISNAYWSPYREQRYTVPALPLSRILPIPLAQPLFNLARPIAFGFHTLPVNRLRREHGLASLGFDLRRIYTDADRVLYADIAELFPLRDAPETHEFIGPIVWSPPVDPPAWWDELPGDRPIIYVTVGSSGNGGALPLILEALGPLPVLAQLPQ